MTIYHVYEYDILRAMQCNVYKTVQSTVLVKGYQELLFKMLVLLLPFDIEVSVNS